MSKGGDTPLAAKIALWGGREIAGLLLVSLLAGTATIPYIAYHFHRISPYGVLANLMAMPVVSAWVMPAGVLGLISMPLGFDGLWWRLMGHGIEWMISVALWVTSFPGAVGRMAAFGTGPLLLCTAGLVVLCLLKTPLRFIGGLLISGAIVLMLRAPQPDVLIAADGSAAAVRGENGRFSVVKSGSDLFALREWLAADADARAPNDSTLGEGIRCDPAGCVGKLRDGSLVAIARTTEAFEEDCRRAVLVVARAMRRPAAPRWSSTARSGDAPERWRCAALANASRSPRRGLWASIARGDVLLRQKTTRPRRPAGCHPSPATPRRAKRTWRPAIEIVAPLLRWSKRGEGD